MRVDQECAESCYQQRAAAIYDAWKQTQTVWAWRVSKLLYGQAVYFILCDICPSPACVENGVGMEGIKTTILLSCLLHPV